MQSRAKRNRTLACRWLVYFLLLLVADMLQTMPRLQLFGVKPIFILPLCLMVALLEGEFAGALFGVVGGLLWDCAAGRTVGLLALGLMIVCFFGSILFQTYLRSNKLNYVILSAASALVVLSSDYLFFYVMPGYTGAGRRYLCVILPQVVLAGLLGLVDHAILKKVHHRFAVEED